MDQNGNNNFFSNNYTIHSLVNRQKILHIILFAMLTWLILIYRPLRIASELSARWMSLFKTKDIFTTLNFSFFYEKSIPWFKLKNSNLLYF